MENQHKVIIAGASGMVGHLVLQYCLEDERIGEVISFARRPGGVQHSKLTEVIIKDFLQWDAQAAYFQGATALFCCIGVYTGALPKEAFIEASVDIPLALAKALERSAPGAKYCLLSGQGADRTEKNRILFAWTKGKVENRISELNLQFHSFRPAYIYPVETRQEPNFSYRLSRSLYPLIRRLGKAYSIPSTDLAKTIVRVGLDVSIEQEVFENTDLDHSE
ncbi:MAG: NAD-dependent epimerase/dehydratase family protein [Bacteroidota bacterium]